MEKINHNKIIIAREYRKIKQSKLLEILNKKYSIKITQSDLSRIEKGYKVNISQELITAISEILDFPPTFFYMEGDIIDVKLSLFRKRQKLKSSDISFILGSVNIFVDICNLLLNDTKELNIDVPYFPIEKYKNPEQIARALRIHWNIPQGPIMNLTEIMEDNGIIINYIDPNSKYFDGCSYTKYGLYFVFINPNMPGDRQRFTLAHELGHIIMRNSSSPIKESENEANRFAAEFLMPEIEIGYNLKKIDLEKACYLKPYWKVSIAAIIRRALTLKYINQARYKSLCSYMAQKGYNTKEPFDIPKEIPTLFKEIIDIYRKEDNLSYDKIAQMTHIPKIELLKFYNPQMNKIARVS